MSAQKELFMGEWFMDPVCGQGPNGDLVVLFTRNVLQIGH
jgi:hypothetical protein